MLFLIVSFVSKTEVLQLQVVVFPKVFPLTVSKNTIQYECLYTLYPLTFEPGYLDAMATEANTAGPRHVAP